MKYIMLIMIGFIIVGCGSDSTITYYSEPTEEVDDNGTNRDGMFIDDSNVSDITSATDVSSITITDNGMFVLCTDGSDCSLTIDNSNDSNNTTDGSNTTDNSIDNTDNSIDNTDSSIDTIVDTPPLDTPSL